MLFLKVCPILFDLLSRKFIRQHFFIPLVKLAGEWASYLLAFLHVDV